MDTQYTDRIHEVSDELQDMQQKFQAQETSLQHIQAMVDGVGMTETIGVLLRSQEHGLLPVRPLRLRLDQITKEIPQVELDLLQTRDRREAMWDLEELTDATLARVSPSLFDRVSEAKARELVRGLLDARQKNLDLLLKDLQDYEVTLTNLSVVMQNTIAVTRDYQSYIDEHVLWIRSAEPLTLGDVLASKQGLAAILDGQECLKVVQDVGTLLQRHLAAGVAALVLLGVVLVLCDRVKDRIDRQSESKQVQLASSFLPTAEVFFETILLAWFRPLVCFVLGWLLVNARDAGDLTMAVGTGLIWTASMWLGLAFLHHTARPTGLAEKHFGWHTHNLLVLRRNLRFLIAFGLPAVFIVMVIHSFQDGRWINSLGRIAFILGMFVMTLFMHRLLNPYRAASGLWANRDVWMYQLRHGLHVVGVAIPLSLLALNAIGYVYSANQLAYRAQQMEIFANFVSGLIILTERPVRVGDMVTVGGVTGKVTRVQIRATTISDFDRRELVVPNKRFITEDVINWTLSDPITRVVLPIGIAYDADPQLARETLLHVAANQALVLKDPEPTAIFMGFGDSTLDLELRVFIVGRDTLFQVRDELNLAINSAFRERKLEIAYPQRDLHIRSVDAQALTPYFVSAERKAA